MSEKELISIIKQEFSNQLSIYEKGLREIFSSVLMGSILPTDIMQKITENTKSFRTTVADALYFPLCKNDGRISERLTNALENPTICALSEDFSIEHFLANGFSAGCIYCFYYYALFNKPSLNTKVFLALDEFEADLEIETTKKVRASLF